MFVLYHLPKDIENIVWYYVHHDIFLPSLNAIKSLEFRENNPTIYSKHHSRCVNLYCIIDTDNYRLRKKRSIRNENFCHGCLDSKYGQQLFCGLCGWIGQFGKCNSYPDTIVTARFYYAFFPKKALQIVRKEIQFLS